MNKLENDKLKIFMQDEVLYNAVKKVFLYEIGSDLDFNPDSSDAVIGQQTRARNEATKLLDKGFKRLERFKKVEHNEKENINIAR